MSQSILEETPIYVNWKMLSKVDKSAALQSMSPEFDD